MGTLVAGGGLVVGLDRSADLLRRGSVNAEADRLPFGAGAFATVLAADLFHHLDDGELVSVLGEIRRVLASGGRLVAWWYERAGIDAPDAPRFPRTFGDVAQRVAGFGRVEALSLEVTLEAGPPTVGLLAVR